MKITALEEQKPRRGQHHADDGDASSYNRLGDAFSMLTSSAAFADKNAGNCKTVNVSGSLNVTGTNSANYTFFSPTTTSDRNITAVAVALFWR